MWMTLALRRIGRKKRLQYTHAVCPPSLIRSAARVVLIYTCSDVFCGDHCSCSQGIGLVQQQGIVLAQKQDMVLPQKHDIASAQTQDVDLVQKQDVVLVQNHDIVLVQNVTLVQT